MSRAEIRRLLVDVDPGISQEIMQLVVNISNQMASYKSRYTAALEQLNSVKGELNGEVDDERLIRKSIYKIARYKEVRIYYNKELHKFSIRSIRFDDSYGFDMVGHYKAPYNAIEIKEDMRETLKESKL